MLLAMIARVNYRSRPSRGLVGGAKKENGSKSARAMTAGGHRKRHASDLTATNRRAATSGSVSVEGVFPTSDNATKLRACFRSKCT